MSNILTAHKVCLEYQIREGLFRTFTHKALKDVSLTIERGETFGVIGKNGSGKSSLLQVITGLIPPTSGTLEFGHPEVRRSLLTLGLGFRPDLSGQDNVILSLMLQQFTRKQALERLDEIREFADIGEFFDKPVRTYSAGMRARLGFATGIFSEVDILLIDEVLSVGDAGFRKKAETRMLQRLESTQTVILVSQSPAQIRELCDRALWIHNASVQCVGPSEEIAKDYNSFVAKETGH